MQRIAGTARGVWPLLITGIAVVVFSTAGIARMMGWGPNSVDDTGNLLAGDQASRAPGTGEARAGPRCPECGMIVSVREIEGRGYRDESRVKPARKYEFAVRMADGTSRVIEDANPARWRTGEHLIVIGGATPPER